jgi:hypothetical protein
VTRWHSTTSAVPRELGHLLELAGRRTHPDDHAQGEAQPSRVDLGPIARDDAAALEPAQTLGGRLRGEADAAAELDQRQAGVRLERLEDAQVGDVQQAITRHTRGSPRFRRHSGEHSVFSAVDRLVGGASHEHGVHDRPQLGGGAG